MSGQIGCSSTACHTSFETDLDLAAVFVLSLLCVEADLVVLLLAAPFSGPLAAARGIAFVVGLVGDDFTAATTPVMVADHKHRPDSRALPSAAMTRAPASRLPIQMYFRDRLLGGIGFFPVVARRPGTLLRRWPAGGYVQQSLLVPAALPARRLMPDSSLSAARADIGPSGSSNGRNIRDIRVATDDERTKSW